MNIFTQQNISSVSTSNKDVITPSARKTITIPQDFSLKNINNIKLAICIMVKNESKRIMVTLSSIKTIADMITILDTGSTDDTLDIIKKFGQENKIPVNVKSKRFDIDSNGKECIFDFRISRNYLLNYSEEFPHTWKLLLDSNDEVKNPEHVKLILNSYKGSAIGFYIKQEWYYGTKIDKFPNIRIIKSNSGFLYGASNPHEALINPRYDITKSIHEDINKKVVDFMAVTIYQDRTQDNAKSFTRFERDKKSFAEEIKRLEPKYKNIKDVSKIKSSVENSKDKIVIDDKFTSIDLSEYGLYTRCLFYQGQTCMGLGEYQESFKWYSQRARHTIIFPEEIYISLYQCAKLSMILEHDVEETMVWAIKAFEVSKRIEPLLMIAQMYIDYFEKNRIIGTDEKGNKNVSIPAFLSSKIFNRLLLAQMYCKMACRLEYPLNDNLFVDIRAYEYVRWKLLAIINSCILSFNIFYLKESIKEIYDEGLTAAKKISNQSNKYLSDFMKTINGQELNSQMVNVKNELINQHEHDKIIIKEYELYDSMEK